MLAGDSSFGELNMEIMESIIVSTVCTGLHRSLACSYPVGSSPGECRIEIQTRPSEYTFGCHTSDTNFTEGGLFG
jgi:hypothetical protein